MKTDSCCILNAGSGAWAFAGLADQLGRAVWLDVSEVPPPITRLVASLAEAEQMPAEEPVREWCLKFPTGCGGAGTLEQTAQLAEGGDSFLFRAHGRNGFHRNPAVAPRRHRVGVLADRDSRATGLAAAHKPAAASTL